MRETHDGRRINRSRWRRLTKKCFPLITTGVCVLVLHGCSVETEKPGIYLMDHLGSAPRWIADGPGAPVWSQSGDSLAWGGEDGVYIWEGARDEPRRLTSEPVAGRVAWAPDGSAIAYVSRDLGTLEVVDAITGDQRLAVPLSGTATVAVPPAIVVLGGPSWAPDGNRIAYVCWDGQGDEVCIVDVADGHVRQVSRLEPASSGTARAGSGQVAAANVGPPAWSPDGMALAVAAYPERRGGPAGIFVVDVEGGRAQRVSQQLPNSEIQWFPDGTALLFSAAEAGRTDIFRVVVDGSGTTNLTSDLAGNSRWPAAIDAGARVGMVQERDVVILDEDGAVTTVWASPSRGDVRNPSWKPASEAIAFQVTFDIISQYD